MLRTQIRLMAPTSELAGAYADKVVREYEAHQRKSEKRPTENRTEAQVDHDLRAGKRADGTFKRGLGWLK